MRGYPDFAHIGFKVLCSIWGLRTIQHMSFLEDYKRQKYNLLKSSFEASKQLK